MNLEQLREFIQKRPWVAYPLIGLTTLVIGSLLMMLAPQETHKSNPISSKSSNIGLSVGGADQQAYVARLEKNYYDFEDRVKSVEQDVKSIKSAAQDLRKQQKEMAKTVLKLDEKLVNKMEERLNEIQQGGGRGPNSQSLELAVANIKPLQKDEDDSVYLPMGSFCQGTLLTGVYAAADVNNPLPVLIALDEAFYGPNKTRVPLKGAFVLGKAYGDLVSERALIQIVAVSSVLPNGHAFEREENLGYITDEFGELGVHGQIVRNTGKELAMSFMGGFMAGGSQALASDEVTSTSTPYGTVSRQLTGDATKNAVFSGLAKSAGRLSGYYEKQTENLIPAVHVHSGIKVQFIVQKGVNINGLPRTDYAPVAAVN